MFGSCRRFKPDENTRYKGTHQISVFSLTQFDNGLNDPGAERFLKLFAEHHGMRRDWPLLFKGSSRVEDLFIEFFRYIASDDCYIDLSLLQGLPALAVSTPDPVERNLMPVVWVSETPWSSQISFP